MRLTQTHTYALLEISQAAYDEIAAKLREASYDHAFLDGGAIDMHGLAVTRAAAEPENELLVFLAIHAAKYADDNALNGLHPTHYDLMEKHGARMVSWKRATNVRVVPPQ
jgi:hypothetical protein